MLIKYITKDNKSKSLDIDSRHVEIGRNSKNTVSIPDKRLSRKHLLIIRDGNQLRIKDLGSTNGTYLDGRKIKPNAYYNIDNHSNIKVGNTLLIIHQLVEKSFNKNNLPVEAVKGELVRRESSRDYFQEDNKYKGMGNEFEYAMHANKSFVGPAWITFFLYYIGFWIGGVIANILFLNSARTTQRVIDRDPPGLGCLWFLIWVHIFLPLLFGGIFAIFILSGVLSL